MPGPESLANFGNLEAWNRGVVLVARPLRAGWPGIALFALLFLAVGVAASMLLPRTYSTQARLLVKKNLVMPALANPKRAVPSGSEAAAQAAYESVLSRESLEALVASTSLMARWERDRPLVLKAKDQVMALVRGPLADDDKLDALVDVLSRRISVDVTDNVVAVKAVWTDRQTALDKTNGAVEAFLESRRLFDVQSVADTLEILEQSAALAKAQMTERLAQAVDRQRVAQEERLSRLRQRQNATRKPDTAPRTDEALESLKGLVRNARAFRQSLEKGYQETLTQLQTRLAERRAVLTPQHPDIAALERALARARVVPADLAAARADEGRLMADYTARGGKPPLVDEDPRVRAAETAADTGANAAAELAVFKDDEEDDATSYARSLLKGSLETYQDLTARIENAQIELQTAEVAFRYRYNVVTPARLPRKPDAPNVPLMIVGALIAGLAAGAVRAVFADLRRQALLTPAALAAYLTAASGPSASAA